MKLILATRNYYLEYGLRLLLKGCRVILAQEFFMPENRRVILDSKESWLIICDSQLGHLMRSMFQGRRFIQLDLEALKGGHDIHNAVRNRLWTWNIQIVQQYALYLMLMHFLAWLMTVQFTL